MRNLIWLMIMLLLPFSLVGCKTSEDDKLGKFYSLQDAYDEGLITKSDLIHIIYFMNGSMSELKEPFEPQIEIPNNDDLDSEILEKMKESFYKLHRKNIDKELDWNITNGQLPDTTNAIATISIYSFLGEFNGVFAVQVVSSLWEYDLGSYPITLAGLTWEQFAPEVIIYKQF